MGKKLTYKEAVWTAGFMGVTAAAVTMELIAVAKKDDEIPPWTSLIVNYVPKPVAFAAAGYLSTWLPLHLVKYFKKAGKLWGLFWWSSVAS